MWGFEGKGGAREAEEIYLRGLYYSSRVLSPNREVDFETGFGVILCDDLFGTGLRPLVSNIVTDFALVPLRDMRGVLECAAPNDAAESRS